MAKTRQIKSADDAEPPPTSDVILIFHVRSARQKAMAAARAEVMSLLREFWARSYSRGDPWVSGEVSSGYAFQNKSSRTSANVCPYSDTRLRVQRVVVLEGKPHGKARKGHSTQVWRGRPFQLVPLYAEDDKDFREKAPDRRTFVLRIHDGLVEGDSRVQGR